MRAFTLITSASLAAVASAAIAPRSVSTVFQTYGECQSLIKTTVPHTVAATTTTVTTTNPGTTTVSRYPANAALAPEITPAPEAKRAELSERDLTIIYSWICTGTETETYTYFSDITTPGTATATATEWAHTSTYTLCIPGHVCG
ncbi:unnamed protein product [Peniophora sp. CBMAI 1063]|nr:unnamed protein product [Peniophora sp. CBMAI 1063]